MHSFVQIVYTIHGLTHNILIIHGLTHNIQNISFGRSAQKFNNHWLFIITYNQNKCLSPIYWTEHMFRNCQIVS